MNTFTLTTSTTSLSRYYSWWVCCTTTEASFSNIASQALPQIHVPYGARDPGSKRWLPSSTRVRWETLVRTPWIRLMYPHTYTPKVVAQKDPIEFPFT